MSYIGKTPQIGGYHKLDSITCDGSTSYTMQLNSSNFSPESVNHMIVSVNGVIQAPTTSYTISSSTITFASALTSSDTIDFIMCLGNVLDIGTPSDGTISASKLATTSITGQTSEATANDADSILIYDDSATALRKMTRGNFLSGVGGTNTPAFMAYLASGGQSVTAGTPTKMPLTIEILDTNSAFDSSTNYRFTVPSGEGGYYNIVFGAQRSAWASNRFEAMVRKNGTSILFAESYSAVNDYTSANASGILNLSAGDYIELFVYHNGSGTQTVRGSNTEVFTYMGGFKLIGA